MIPRLTIENPAYFDRLADIETRHWWSLGVWTLASHWLDDALEDRRGVRAIDVGCGTGMTALRLSRHPAIDAVVGLDPSPEALGHARGRHEFPLVVGSALDLPFPDRHFDLATCFDTLQHLPPDGDRRALGEVFRVLTPGGFVLIRSNGRGWSGDVSAYRLAGLVERVRSAGFEVRRQSYANCLPAVAQEVRGRVGRAGGKKGHPSGGGLRIAIPSPAVNRVLTRVARAEAYVAGPIGIRLPFGHSTMVLAKRPGS